MKKYDKYFKEEAVKKYLDGQSVASISREIGVNENTIHNLCRMGSFGIWQLFRISSRAGLSGGKYRQI
jgi:hypothetical protein